MIWMTAKLHVSKHLMMIITSVVTNGAHVINMLLPKSGHPSTISYIIRNYNMDTGIVAYCWSLCVVSCCLLN